MGLISIHSNFLENFAHQDFDARTCINGLSINYASTAKPVVAEKMQFENEM